MDKKMKCHYEVLGVSRTASNYEINKAYRKLALKWRPKKNISNPEEAKEQFQVVQQAWEVLSDAHERAWYGKHRQAILKGGDYKDEGINLFRYFSSNCVKSYNDDENGFYVIYRLAFEKIAAEDAEFAEEEESDEEIPTFGDSESSYDIVYNFYAYWESYITKKSFIWLNPYDLRYMPNRKVARLAEKENKRIRDKAKRERNEQVRNLVAFVKKRDKRVEAHIKLLAERAKEKAKEAQLHKKRQYLERQKLLKEEKVSAWWHWSNFSNMENESEATKANLAAEFGEQVFSDAGADSNDNASYCTACNELFKTREALRNENSKKHKDNIIALKAVMNEEEKQSSSEESDSSDDNILSESEESEESEECGREDKTYLLQQLRIDMDYVSSSDEEFISVQEKKDEDKSVVASCKSKKRSKRKNGRGSPKVNISEDEDDVNIDDTDWLSKKQRKKQQKAMLVSSIEEEKQSVKERRQRRQTERQIRDRDTIYDFSKIKDTEIHCWGYFCELCSAEFTTKNRLFEHLKKTGHAVHIPDKARNKKNNGEQTSKTIGNFYRRNN